MFVKVVNIIILIMSNLLSKYKRIPTQADLARKFKVTEAYISMILSGKRKNPTLLKKITKIINDHLKAA